MSTTVIYWIILTGLYAAYMTVTITIDLFGKKGEKKETTEIIPGDNVIDDVDDDDTSSNIVEESADGGYQIYDGGVTEDLSSVEEDVSSDSDDPIDDDDVLHEEKPVSSMDDDAILDQESEEMFAQYERLLSIKDDMESVSPSYQDEYSSEDLAVILAQPLDSKVKILRNIVHIH